VAFTTWSAYRTALLDAMASGTYLHTSYTTPAGTSVSFRTLKELEKHLEFVDRMIAIDEGETGGTVTYADFRDLDSA